MEGEFMLSDINISFKKKIVPKSDKLSGSEVVMTLISSTTGIGFLVLPLAFAYCGWGLSLLLCIAISVLQFNANYALIRVASKLKVSNYPALIEKVLQTPWRINLLHNLLFFTNFMTILIYVYVMQNIIDTTTTDFLKSPHSVIRIIGNLLSGISALGWILIINLFLFASIIAKSRFSNFSWLSFCSVCAILFAVVCVSVMSIKARNNDVIFVEVAIWNVS